MSDIGKLSDKLWRLEHLYHIVDKNALKVRFRQNLIQRRITRSKSNRKAILKARQFGVSTNEILDLFDDTIWKANQTNCILAHEKDSIEKLFRIVTRAYNFLSEEFKPVLAKGGGSKYEMFFPEINSRIYCDLESRSDTIHRLHVSEAAFFKDPDKLRATLQAVPLGCPVTLETTPNGVGNFYYDLWNDPESPYEKLFFPWYLYPDYRLSSGIKPSHWTAEEKELAKKAAKLFGVKITSEQMAFRRFKKAELKDLFIQEYPEDDQTCFLSSGNAAVDLVLVKALLDACPAPAREEDHVKIFKERDKRKTYVIGGDTSEGAGKDYSVAHVWEVETRTQVATIRSNRWKPSDFAHRVNDLAHIYQNPGNVLPLVAIERNNHGHAVLLELEEHLHYPNLFRTEDEKLGWLTDRVTRPVMVDVFIQGLENRSATILDRVTLQECLTLVNNDGKIEASDGKNDDTVMAGAIGLQMCIREGAGSIYRNMESYIRI